MGLLLVVAVLSLIAWLTTRYIPNQQVGVVEKLWSSGGSVPEGSIIALAGEAGFQADLLRGGLHFGLWRWQYRVHKVPLVTIPQGKIGYVYARDGESLPPSQTLGRVVACNNFQDARTFLGEPAEEGAASERGQRGRQRAILREGVYAINPALFVIITENAVYHLDKHGQRELETLVNWQRELRRMDGFSPVIIGAPIQYVADVEDEADTGQTVVASDAVRVRRPRSAAAGSEASGSSEGSSVPLDTIGIVTVHDGPSLPPGEIIAPGVGNASTDPNFHNNYQDPEAFLRAGGRRGRQ
jgi:hypothetical protein